MRRGFAIAAGLLMLALANVAIYGKEKLLTEGRVVLLELAPVDPRSLVQGDYMALAFQVAQEAFRREASEERAADGRIVLKLDEHGVGRFVRFDDGRPLTAGEVRMRYRIRGGRPKFATNAFLFEEGRARIYERARYGEFRVAIDGEAILTGLRAEDFVPLGAQSQP